MNIYEYEHTVKLKYYKQSFGISKRFVFGMFFQKNL